MDTEIYLINKIKTSDVDQYGDPVYEETYDKVFAEKTDVGFTEFYQAMSNGYKPEVRFKVYDLFVYNGQEELVFENIRYKILRSYNTGDHIEIICYGGVRDERAEISH